MISVKKMAAVTAMSAAALIGSGAMSVLPASAATPTSASASASAAVPAADPILCTSKGFLCVQNLSGENLPATIKAWADTKTFTGYFELQFPDGVTKRSSTGTWKAGGAGFNFTGVPQANGYNMIAVSGSKEIDNKSFNVD